MKKSKEFTRRDFIKGTTGVAARQWCLAFPTIIPSSAFGANDKVQMAVLGVNGRGQDHIKGLQKQENAQVVCLCDPDKVILKTRADEFETQYGKKVKMEQDLRRVFDDKSIDAVTIATPNHWHTLAAIWAMQAGKDVYVEKTWHT